MSFQCTTLTDVQDLTFTMHDVSGQPELRLVVSQRFYKGNADKDNNAYVIGIPQLIRKS